MSPEPIRVLLIDDDPGDAEAARAALGDGFVLEWVDALVSGLDRLAEGGIDACLMGLTLPESKSPRTILAARAQAPDVPILVLASHGDEELVERALAEGAQDCVLKDRLEVELIAHVVRQAIDRHRVDARPPRAPVMDGLTNLLNARGLAAIGERQVRVATATRRPFALLYVGLDSYEAGEQLLLDVAGLLSGTFRAWDVIARVADDEFCVLLTEVTPDGTGEERACARLERTVERFNLRRAGSRRPVELTVGAAHFDPASPSSFDELHAHAERLMRQNRRKAA
jgi:diguanylate cyclase (GGDEF)-like protein